MADSGDILTILPPEVVEIISGYLNVQDTCRCSSVSRSWRRYFSHDRMWAKFCDLEGLTSAPDDEEKLKHKFQRFMRKLITFETDVVVTRLNLRKWTETWSTGNLSLKVCVGEKLIAVASPGGGAGGVDTPSILTLWDSDTKHLVKSFEPNIPKRHEVRDMKIKDACISLYTQLDDDTPRADNQMLMLYDLSDWNLIFAATGFCGECMYHEADFSVKRDLILYTNTDSSTGGCQLTLKKISTRETIISFVQEFQTEVDTGCPDHECFVNGLRLEFSKSPTDKSFFVLWHRRGLVKIHKMSFVDNLIISEDTISFTEFQEECVLGSGYIKILRLLEEDCPSQDQSLVVASHTYYLNFRSNYEQRDLCFLAEPIKVEFHLKPAKYMYRTWNISRPEIFAFGEHFGIIADKGLDEGEHFDFLEVFHLSKTFHTKSTAEHIGTIKLPSAVHPMSESEDDDWTLGWSGGMHYVETSWIDRVGEADYHGVIAISVKDQRSSKSEKSEIRVVQCIL